MGDFEHYLLSEVKRHDCLGLLREAMQKLGAASQTLAAVRRLALKNGETFASAAKIAEMACRPKRSVERDLEVLVRNKWLKRRGREKRRTPTYIVDADLMNGEDARRFAILPRWAAHKLERSWAERAIFAAIISRDSLNDFIGDGEAGENFGRLQYSARQLALDTGVSLRAVVTAKAELAALGLIQVDPAMLWHESDGRLRTIPDTLMLNLDYEVPAYLVDRSANLADCRSAKVADCNPSPECKSGGDPVQNWRGGGANLAVGGVQKWRLQLSQYSKSISKGTSTSTAEPLSASPLVCEEEEGNGEYGPKNLVAKFHENFGSSCPLKIEEAIASALGNGCSLDQLRVRARWAWERRFEWKHEHRAGALYVGIAEATPDLQPNQGWPYL